MATPKLALIPSGYKSQTVYSVLPSDGTSDFSFSRSFGGSATRVNKNGLIEEVSVNIPRLDYSDGSCPSLLLEANKTNLVTYNRDLTNSDWIKFNNSTVTADQLTSPSGELNADKIVFGTGVSLITNNVTVVDATSYTLSIYLRGENGGEQVQLDFKNNTSQGVSGTLFTLTNQWVRYSVTLTANQTNLGLQLRTPNLTESKTIYAWGGQLELGSISSFIPTTTAQTRLAETCSVTTPSGVTRITETFSDETTNTITTIPSTYTVSLGKVLKVIMD
jgi:hypothetical protein